MDSKIYDISHESEKLRELVSYKYEDIGRACLELARGAETAKYWHDDRLGPWHQLSTIVSSVSHEGRADVGLELIAGFVQRDDVEGETLTLVKAQWRTPDLKLVDHNLILRSEIDRGSLRDFRKLRKDMTNVQDALGVIEYRQQLRP